MKVTPVLLIILDGFGYREECDDNAICQARKPHWNFLWATYPHTTIDASEKWVGLPAAQMGNSEVGHMNIGAGRVVFQDYTRIEHAIETGEFFANPVLAQGRRDRPRAEARAARARPRLAGRRAQPRIADPRDGRHGGASGRYRTCACTRFSTAGTRRRKAREPRSPRSQEKCAKLGAGTHRVDLRPLLRDGPRPALGARGGGLRPDHRGQGEFQAADPRSTGSGGLRARRDRRVREADRDRAARGGSRSHERRRRRGLHEFPRRSRAPDDRCADRSEVRRLRARPRADAGLFLHADELRRRFRPHARRVRAAKRRQRLRRVPRAAGLCGNCASPRRRSTRTSRISSTAASRRRTRARIA